MGSKHQWTDATHIKAFMERTNLSEKELADVWGYTTGAVRAWVIQNRAPVWTKTAIEGLVRRMGGKALYDNYVYVIRCTETVRPAITAFLNALDGVSYAEFKDK